MLKAGTAARRRSIRPDVPLAAVDARRHVELFLHTVDRRLQERDPSWVGHCKLLVASGESTAYASVTAANDSPRWSGALPEIVAAELTVYLAIYGWSDSQVAEVLDGALAAEPLFDQPDLMPG